MSTAGHGIATQATPKLTQSTTTTPLSKGNPLQFCTLDSVVYCLRGTNTRCNVVIPELREQVPEVPLGWYFEHLLPPLPVGIDPKEIVTSLKRSGVITNNRWAAIAEHPRLDNRHEDEVYAGLEEIFEHIINAATTQNSNLKQEFALKLTPGVEATSERVSITKLEGYFTSLEEAARLARAGSKPSVYNVWDSHEFKKDNEGVTHAMDKCVSQLVYDMQQIMALDSCRRFTFGTSIMNRSFRLWFCSRGAFLTAKPFDFMSEPEKLVHVFISFAFASRTEAGWDPSMTCILPTSPTDKRQYRIRVRDKTYITTKILSDYAADSPIGRATRVWLVKDEDGLSDSRYVLKDVWVDSERQTEDEIRSALLKDVDEKCGSDARSKVEKHLLTPVAFEKLHIDTIVDDTTQLIMRGGCIPKTLDHLRLIVLQQSGLSTRSQVSTTENPVDVVFSGTRARYFQHGDTSQHGPRVNSRFHYRIVFLECATTMYDEKHLSNVLGALGDVTEVLRWIHKSHWVHRDISGGNVYWYDCQAQGLEGDNRGLLGDLEFAKVRTPSSSHEVRTGTFNFMASEVIAGCYLLEPALDLDFFKDPTKLLATDVFDTPPFAFNPLHDLESIWWILIYLLYFNDDKQNLADAELADARTAKAQLLFNQEGQTLDRKQFLQAHRKLTVEKTRLPPSFQSVIAIARAFAARLHTAYCEYEARLSDLAIVDEQPFEIHEYLVMILGLGRNNPQVNSIEFVGVTRMQKRKIDEAESCRDDETSNNKKARRNV
ncbi:hypothetical protein GGU10DRAFT_15723 [Lentinula aff. detonsa]|uniref:Fungal-type protein kinase domain-containing protein n=1 Tax=Lentinula aff. detonsa TaxID=2804958 RepID=A0AA38K9S9_9AGAR|nr:hypothetical protein GGU10DRAFT_15723 [Lentinula aff. detonsa]